MEIKILDSGIFIKKEIVDFRDNVMLYTTENVIEEIKDDQTKMFFNERYFNIVVRNPSIESIKNIKEFIKKTNNNLSECDISLIALTYELYNEIHGQWISDTNYKNNISNTKITLLTYDIGMQSIIKDLGMGEFTISEKYFKYRCFACFSVFNEKVDFCKLCGHKTVTRVAFIKEDGKEIMCLKKGYNYKEKIIKDKKGLNIVCEDIPEYKKYVRYQRYIKNKNHII